MTNWALNLPHVIISGIALIIGFSRRRRPLRCGSTWRQGKKARPVPPRGADVSAASLKRLVKAAFLAVLLAGSLVGRVHRG